MRRTVIILAALLTFACRHHRQTHHIDIGEAWYAGRPVLPRTVIGDPPRPALVATDRTDKQGRPILYFADMDAALEFYRHHSSTSDETVITKWIKDHANPVGDGFTITAVVLP